MNEVNATTRPERAHDIENLVAAACRLVGSDTGVRSVRLLTPSRPTYEELRCYQEWARDRHVRLSVDGEGVVTMRPGCDAQNVR
jgi:hypothetical protein